MSDQEQERQPIGALTAEGFISNREAAGRYLNEAAHKLRRAAFYLYADLQGQMAQQAGVLAQTVEGLRQDLDGLPKSAGKEQTP